MADDLFKIKPIGGKNIVVEDKRKTVSPFNSAKHFKDANIRLANARGWQN